MLPDRIARILTRLMEGSSSSNPRRSSNDDHDELLLSKLLQSAAMISPHHHQSLSKNLLEASSDAHVLNLVHQLYNLQQGEHTSTTAYLHTAKHLADRLASAGRPITLSEFNVFALKGLRPEFKDLVITLAARPGPVSFAELHSLLVSHEFIHGHDQFSSSTLSSLPPRSDGGGVYVKKTNHHHQYLMSSPKGLGFCQWCSNPGHTARSCSYLVQQQDFLSTTTDHHQHFVSTTEKHNCLTMANKSKVEMVDGDHRTNSRSMVRGINDDDRGISSDDFPQDFVFGTATSSYQVRY